MARITLDADVVAWIMEIEEKQGKEKAADTALYIIKFLSAQPQERVKLMEQFFADYTDRISKLEERLNNAQ